MVHVIVPTFLFVSVVGALSVAAIYSSTLLAIAYPKPAACIVTGIFLWRLAPWLSFPV